MVSIVELAGVIFGCRYLWRCPRLVGGVDRLCGFSGGWACVVLLCMCAPTCVGQVAAGLVQAPVVCGLRVLMFRLIFVLDAGGIFCGLASGAGSNCQLILYFWRGVHQNQLWKAHVSTM